MKYHLNTETDIEKILEKFNYFNDGFIKKLTITNLDSFGSDGGRNLLGDFGIEMFICQINDDKGCLYDCAVKVIFRDVKSIKLSIGADPLETEIESLKIVKVNDANSKDYLSLKIITPCFNKAAKQYINKEHEMFLFKKAIFQDGLKIKRKIEDF